VSWDFVSISWACWCTVIFNKESNAVFGKIICNEPCLEDEDEEEPEKLDEEEEEEEEEYVVKNPSIAEDNKHNDPRRIAKEKGKDL
jgi:hypothetical protein